MSRIRWSENLTCPRCGKMGKVMFSGLGIPDPADGEKDRVEQGCAGFATEAAELGFRFRCVACNRDASVTKAKTAS
jgi:transcription elongation factor Elf1